MSTPLLDRIARVQAARLCATCHEPESANPAFSGLHRFGPTTHDWTPERQSIPQSPFVRRALAGELPAKEVNR